MREESGMKEARRGLNRLRRALEKAQSELEDVSSALKSAEGAEFPADLFEESVQRLADVMQFVEEQEQRLQEKVLQGGGIDTSRLRRG